MMQLSIRNFWCWRRFSRNLSLFALCQGGAASAGNTEDREQFLWEIGALAGFDEESGRAISFTYLEVEENAL